MTRITAFLFSLCIVHWALCIEHVADFEVIPLPQSIVSAPAETPFVLDGTVAVVAPGGDSVMQRNAQMLCDYVKQSTGISVNAQCPPDSNSQFSIRNSQLKKIVLLADLHDDNPEAYRLSVTASEVTIQGASAAAVFHGIMTLRKALPVNNAQCTMHNAQCLPGCNSQFSILNSQFDKVLLPAVEIRDAPRFAYRGAHLDVCRHFWTVDEVKTFIDMLALHNINNFHWHLTDDQGWRIEIKKYPRLTQVGAWRDSTVIGRNAGKWLHERHGGYYTQEQAREIVRYAAERHINVVPEIEMPGHTQAILASYPELGCTGGPYEVWTCWGVTPEVICPGNDATMQLIKDVLNEVMDIFPSPFICIGGDECPKDRWKQCPKCQERIRTEGIKPRGKYSTEDQLQGYVTRFACKVVTDRGRSPEGWDEILECDVPEQAIVMSWRGEAGALEGARRGNRVIQAPNSHMYFDFYQSRDMEAEPFAIGGYIPVEKVYGFDPVPQELTPEQGKLIMGCQANLWTEYITTFSHVQYMELPRMAALCEVQWTPLDRKDYQSFLRRIPHLLQLYNLLGWNYARHLCGVTTQFTPVPERKALKVDMSSLQGNEIRYMVSPQAPLKGRVQDSPFRGLGGQEAWSTYTEPLYITHDAVLRSCTVGPLGYPERINEDSIRVNKATFCDIKLNTQPNVNYTFAGAPTLVDGLRGANSYRTGLWLGFCGNDLDATIDLRKVEKISQVAFNADVFQCDGVVDARGIEVYASTDGKRYKLVAREDYPDIVQSEEFVIKRHTAHFKPVKARYVRVVIKSEKCLPAWHAFAASNGFLFVDEIEIN